MASVSMQLYPHRLDEAEVERRLSERKITGLKYSNDATHQAVFAHPSLSEIFFPHGHEYLQGQDPAGQGIPDMLPGHTFSRLQGLISCTYSGVLSFYSWFYR